jgi:Cytochrome P450
MVQLIPLVINRRAIHRDPELYPEPEEFNPNRWLDPKYPTFREPLTQYPNLANYSMFGFGRRICPGQNIAERSLHILTARMLWACNLSHKLDAQGNEIPIPEYDYQPGFNTQPNFFEFDLKVRSEKRKEIIDSEYVESRKNDILRQMK